MKHIILFDMYGNIISEFKLIPKPKINVMPICSGSCAMNVQEQPCIEEIGIFVATQQLELMTKFLMTKS